MRRRGFTLLEVLISLAVLVIGLASIIPLFAVGTRSARRGMDQTMAALIAPHVTARIQERLYETNPKDLKDQEYVQFGKTYKYDATFQPLDPADPSRNAFLVRVVIHWSENSELHQEEFRTILLRRVPR